MGESMDGGLGVLNMRIQNVSQLMRNLYKFMNYVQDISWGQLT
jgi:hypothetical protein